MMKILCVINSLCPGGAQRQLINLALGFKEKGHEISFLAYHNDKFYTSELSENDISTIFIVEPNYLATNSPTNMVLARRINPILPDRKCKVIYNMLMINDNTTPVNSIFQTFTHIEEGARETHTMFLKILFELGIFRFIPFILLKIKLVKISIKQNLSAIMGMSLSLPLKKNESLLG